MTIMLGRAGELYGDDIVAVTYFMQVEESQVTVMRCIAVEPDKALFTYDGASYKPVHRAYYGQMGHALNAYAHVRMSHTDVEGAWPALEKIREVLAEAVKAVREVESLC